MARGFTLLFDGYKRDEGLRDCPEIISRVLYED
jgi:hypothetical protein